MNSKQDINNIVIKTEETKITNDRKKEILTNEYGDFIYNIDIYIIIPSLKI